MISIQHLHKIYGSKEVLNNISIEFQPGVIHGIVGKNGAGKTTFFKCIAGLESYRGNIQSDLHPLKDYLGYLPTDPYFLSKITGREYLRLLLNARDLKVADFDVKNIFELPLDQYADTYSTGMKKKLALSALLMQNNQVFILDEPFNGVDIQSNILINEIILRLRSLGKTVILSSHIFSSLEDTCDHIHLLDEGRFLKSVDKHDFHLLEQELKHVMVGKSIDWI